MVTPDILDGLEVYLVGGAVRDELMGLPVKDRDWVVIGATVDDLRSRGFRPVGREFPVFLHPRNGEEYALARTERKTGPGYRGFEFRADEKVTLHQDLARRDLTINAMARARDGSLIDPFGGAEDIRHGVLRHVSAAFTEDPVRLLRVARFRARYGFDIAPQTLELMRQMVAAGEVDALVPERVWAELRGALSESGPSAFFESLRECGALARVLPEVDALFGVPQRADYHPEIDAGVHTMMVVEQAARLSGDTRVRFASLVHDLGKAVTPKPQLPSHVGHELSGLSCISGLCERLRVPADHRDLALLACELHLKLHRAGELRAASILELLEKTDAFRRPERLDRLLLVGEADARGRRGRETDPYPQADLLRACARAAAAVDAGGIARLAGGGDPAAQAIRRARVNAIETVRRDRAEPGTRSKEDPK